MFDLFFDLIFGLICKEEVPLSFQNFEKEKKMAEVLKNKSTERRNISIQKLQTNL